MTAVNIVDVASWLPDRWMTAAEIGEKSGIPEDIIVERFGLDGKHIAGPEDHNSDMSARAGLLALERAGVAPEDVRMIKKMRGPTGNGRPAIFTFLCFLFFYRFLKDFTFTAMYLRLRSRKFGHVFFVDKFFFGGGFSWAGFHWALRSRKFGHVL